MSLFISIPSLCSTVLVFFFYFFWLLSIFFSSLFTHSKYRKIIRSRWLQAILYCVTAPTCFFFFFFFVAMIILLYFYRFTIPHLVRSWTTWSEFSFIYTYNTPNRMYKVVWWEKLAKQIAGTNWCLTCARALIKFIDHSVIFIAIYIYWYI